MDLLYSWFKKRIKPNHWLNCCSFMLYSNNVFIQMYITSRRIDVLPKNIKSANLTCNVCFNVNSIAFVYTFYIYIKNSLTWICVLIKWNSCSSHELLWRTFVTGGNGKKRVSLTWPHSRLFLNLTKNMWWLETWISKLHGISIHEAESFKDTFVSI